MRFFVTLVVLACLVATVCFVRIKICGMASEMFKISIGMNRSEVIAALGEPENAMAIATSEVLTYKLFDSYFAPYRQAYYVRLKDSRVVNFGPILPKV